MVGPPKKGGLFFPGEGRRGKFQCVTQVVFSIHGKEGPERVSCLGDGNRHVSSRHHSCQIKIEIREGCAVWLLTATGIFCLMRQPRCRPEFTLVTTENQCSLSITLKETNRNLLFEMDSILISVESGLERKREV